MKGLYSWNDKRNNKRTTWVLDSEELDHLKKISQDYKKAVQNIRQFNGLPKSWHEYHDQGIVDGMVELTKSNSDPTFEQLQKYFKAIRKIHKTAGEDLTWEEFVVDTLNINYNNRKLSPNEIKQHCDNRRMGL